MEPNQHRDPLDHVQLIDVRGLDAANLEGGVQAWVQAGHGLVNAAGARGRVA